jgi:hypothetical protein
MKTMKRLMVAVVMMAAGVTVASAAGTANSGSQDRAGQMRERRMQQLDEALKLSAEQKTKIEAIWKKAEAEAAEIRDEGTLRKRKQRRELREMMRETRAEVRAVLTPEQQKIFDTLPRERGGPKAGE